MDKTKKDKFKHRKIEYIEEMDVSNSIFFRISNSLFRSSIYSNGYGNNYYWNLKLERYNHERGWHVVIYRSDATEKNQHSENMIKTICIEYPRMALILLGEFD